MVKARVVKRGEVWLAALDPTVGAEIQKTRPCVIVSPPEIHDWLRTVLVAPMTTGSQPAPFRVPVAFGRKNGLVLPEQMRALDKARLVKRLGAVDAATLTALLAVLRDTFEE
ncbi:MAG: type II toxin-antitoxin system PemK/MazF family toxin [Burkholderiales bacterium]|jgi:mRNA interferase MazF|nr:Endoribonuclease PemK [Rhodocyclaceae bacterium]MCZ2174791.1 type II toxin-antitoxin system PemK/MazF family toxin [Burkholderiales bacterium]OQY72136.1 MAG: growth inhibitor PemK [Rhodocyclaceae bacterium UTPRO2]HNQ56709.1 type II toxin-antitoxin system PemK/MazF family toxin [Candidatus Desulfobacillus denitrificans]MCQ3923739.1 type II toxin-antitoxin system PemK/MazF family toxin [Rhodocyclaceae bacterium]